MASFRSSGVGLMADLQSAVRNVNLQALPNPPQGYSPPHPPNLTDPTLRNDFGRDFIEFTRLVDLHHKFSIAVNAITFPAKYDAEAEATTAIITRAKKLVVTELAFGIWNSVYQYNVAVGGGRGAVRRNMSFKLWAARRIRVLRAALQA